MTEPTLAGLMRTAWKCVRLDAIRVAVEQTIVQLEAVDVAQVLRDAPSAAELDDVAIAVRSALDACCDELRDGCGLSLRHADVGHEGLVTQWHERREEALKNYRLVAFRTLEAALGPLSQNG